MELVGRGQLSGGEGFLQLAGGEKWCTDPVGYVESKQPLEVTQVMYETDSAVSQYCEAHYGRTFFNVDNFAAACAVIYLEHMQGKPKNRALDLGCSVGMPLLNWPKSFTWSMIWIFPPDSSGLPIRCRKKEYCATSCPKKTSKPFYDLKNGSTPL